MKVYEPGEELSDNLSDVTTAKERVAMVWPLTVEARNVAGSEFHDPPHDPWRVKVPHPEKMERGHVPKAG